MNKNLFIYSFKYLAVLLALVTFSSCERTEFTEEDANRLEQERLDAQTRRENDALTAQDKRVMDMAMFRRSMDSLTRINSGGKVWYTVNVVPGGSSAFSSGRFEEVEGLDGATVSVSQLGGAVVESKTTVAGLASFELYSGEVTVNIDAPNHTDLNYTANLTPDGGVANGSLIYVGNVVPVFDDPNNPGAGSEENLATVKGFAFAELDITFGNNFEESVPDGTKIRAFIDVDNEEFKRKYIREANAEEGTNIGGNVTKSGFIQRFAYEEAASTTGTTVTSPLNNDTAPDGGEYSISIGATASGLPIQMKFDDFAADRTFFFGGAGTDGDQGGGAANPFGIGTKRFIYTQNTQGAANQAFGGANGVGGQSPTTINFVGDQPLFEQFLRTNFSLVKTEATATAALTGGDAVASVTVTDGGYYYVAPTVTFTAAPTGGVTATGTAILGPITGTSPEALFAIANGMRQVVGINLNGADGIANTADDTRGTRYTATPTVTFTRFSYTGRAAGTPTAPGLPNANGKGNIMAPTTGISYVQIIDGGYGMTTAVPNPPGPFTTQFEYTGFAPTAVFTPDVTISGNTAATALVAVDTEIGVATEVQMVNPGTGYDQTTVGVRFEYGTGANISTAGQTDQEADGIAIFESNGTGGIRFNDAVAGSGRTIVNLATPPTAEYALSQGSGYSFVPRVTVDGLPTGLGVVAPTFIVTVGGPGPNFGKVISISLNGQGANITAALADVELGTLSIKVTPGEGNIRATAFTTSGGIDNYVITNYGTPGSVYRTSVNNVSAGTTFKYISVDGLGNYRAYVDGVADMTPAGILATAPAVPTELQFDLNSNFAVGFLAPTAGGAAAGGYPIFDNEGTSLVGIVIKTPGANYTPTDNLSFWVIPNAITLAEYAQLGVNANPDANASATAGRSNQVLTLTFTNGGLGYAMRPEFSITGGQRSAEDLAALNSSINAVRASLNFNSLGTITTTSVSIPLAANTFTAQGIAAEPLAVKVSIARLQAVYNREVNYETSGTTGFTGGIEVTTNGVTAINAPGAWVYNSNTGVNIGPLAMFNAMESSSDFTAADRLGSAGANPDFRYITAPTYTITWLGADTGGAGSAVLDPGTADIIALSSTTNGTLPAVAGSIGVTSFNVATNDESYPAAGERFRTIGGRSNFEVFSGLTYIRDVNYGTGIELE